MKYINKENIEGLEIRHMMKQTTEIGEKLRKNENIVRDIKNLERFFNFYNNENRIYTISSKLYSACNSVSILLGKGIKAELWLFIKFISKRTGFASEVTKIQISLETGMDCDLQGVVSFFNEERDVNIHHVYKSFKKETTGIKPWVFDMYNGV